MKKVIRLTESELTRIVRRVVNEQQTVAAKPKTINFMSDKISGVIDYSGYGVKIEGKNELGNYFKPARTLGFDFKRGEFPETEELLSIVDKFLQTNNLMSNVKLQQEIKMAMGQMIYYISSIKREYNRSIKK
jgi:hypothetical protein